MGLIDIGVNLTARAFRGDVDAVIARARSAGVSQMVVTGLTVELSWAAVLLARRYPGVLYTTAGIHPHNARTCSPTTIPELRRLAAEPPVVAIGECGLDYNRNFSPPAVQREWFAAQLALAEELDMPVFLHERDAHRDFLAILRQHRVRGVVHCFTGRRAALDAYLEAGLHIGITGWICDERRGLHLRDLIREIPEDRLMVETDAPFLLPRDLPRRPIRPRRNEPMYLPHVLRRVAASAGRTPEEVVAASQKTAAALFGLS